MWDCFVNLVIYKVSQKDAILKCKASYGSRLWLILMSNGVRQGAIVSCKIMTDNEGIKKTDNQSKDSEQELRKSESCAWDRFPQLLPIYMISRPLKQSPKVDLEVVPQSDTRKNNGSKWSAGTTFRTPLPLNTICQSNTNKFDLVASYKQYTKCNGRGALARSMYGASLFHDEGAGTIHEAVVHEAVVNDA